MHYTDFVHTVCFRESWYSSWLYSSDCEWQVLEIDVQSEISFLLQGLGAVATATGYMIGLFKLSYPHVHNMADAGEVLGGPIGREVLGAAQVVFMVFLCGSHVLTGMIAFDTSESLASPVFNAWKSCS